ncbi:hypothetical protein GCM10023187_06990 [Nibrella viscosa]|uniref:Uncharacterized protein n=1 Tax=Nibrella viscosa TaxID=1084524 RepID=A0ABP8JY37_9BACT
MQAGGNVLPEGYSHSQGEQAQQQVGQSGTVHGGYFHYKGAGPPVLLSKVEPVGFQQIRFGSAS